MTITAQEFINRANKNILIPGFEVEDEPIEIKVRSLSIISMMSRKTIPNPLMPAVNKLFKLGGNVPEEVATAVAEENAAELVELMAFICEKAMVEPKYEEVGEYLTQEQMMAIFNSTQGAVNNLKSFRNK